jgi:hypothetical protein
MKMRILFCNQKNCNLLFNHSEMEDVENQVALIEYEQYHSALSKER